MRLVSFAAQAPSVGRQHHLGAMLDDHQIVDLPAATAARLATRGSASAAALRIAAALTPGNLREFVENGELALDAAVETLDWIGTDGAEKGVAGRRLRFPVDAVELQAAVPEPSLIRDFMAFEEHLQNIYPRLGRAIPDVWYERPVYYKGNPGSVGAHECDVVIPGYADGELDFEFEIAAVIGKAGHGIAESDALGHVFGYTIYNDFSARNIQSQEMTAGLGPAKGKDFDGAHVLGPWLVTADEVGDPYGLAMRAVVNGREWTTGSTADMHWRFEQMIAYVSQAETLRPLDVFGSGTVGGGSAAERGETLHPGDTVELTVSRLGTLRSMVVAA